jgi:serine/threonine protein kinase
MMTTRKLEEGAAPKCLHEMFTADEVQPWEEKRFMNVRKICDATRNHGVVELRRDTKRDQLFAVKKMPNTWVHDNHDDFMKAYPSEREMPWQDVGCTRYLNSINYKYACTLDGVYRDGENTFVMLSFASGGDLVDLVNRDDAPGPSREAALAPLVVELLSGLKELHDMQIVHRDISVENVLLTSSDVSIAGIRIIDFAVSSTRRTSRSVTCKESYQAPEMHVNSEHDAFLAEMFAVGVLIYTIMVKDYPWLSTKTGCCKSFDWVQKNGFHAYCKKRRVRGSDMTISDYLSEPLVHLIEGMLARDPSERLTLGENVWEKERRSVWDEPWIKDWNVVEL